MAIKMNWRSLACVTTALCSLPAVAMAQTAPAPTQEQVQPTSSIDDIVVTARRREERLQDVPLAVTAVSPELLERQNITTVTGLRTTAPSLVIVPGAGANKSTPTFAIRGQSQQELTILADPSVSLYIGDIVAPRSQGSNGSLFDLASVQVLKGPQGTLFGRNSTGGIVQLTPNLPTQDFGGSFAVTYGNFGTLNTEAVLNMPLSDSLAARVAIVNNSDDGYLYDVHLGRNVNYTDNQAIRASLRWTPSDTLSNTLVLDAFHSNEGGAGSFIRAINPNGVFNSAPARAARNYPTLESMLADQQARGNRQTASGTPSFSKVDTLTIANTTQWELNDSVSFKNIFGYRKVDSHSYEDTDGLPIPLLEIERIFEQEQFTNEFQVFGETGNLNWIAGAYYFNETGSDQGASVTGAVDFGNVQPTSVFAYPSWANTFVTADNTSYAIFAQGTYKFDAVPGLSLTAGIRQNWDERTAVVRNQTGTACRFSVDDDGNPATPEVIPTLANCALPLSVDYSEPTWNVSLDYQFGQNKLIYVAHRHGYRTGGFGARATTEAGLRRTFEPEIVDDIEVGVKADWRFDNGAFLRTNLAVYNSDYSDIQRLLQDNTVIPVTTVTTNAESATIRGAEFEFLFRPVASFELSGFWSYTDAKFEKFIDPNGVDLSNTGFSRAPKNVYSVTARYTADIPQEIGSELSFGVSYFHTDDFVDNDSAQPTQITYGYELVNLNMDWRNVYGTDVTLGAYVNNVFDEEYDFGMLDVFSSLGFSSRTPGDPRTYGVRLKYEF
jgi:iron complex outermembrane receptor protein